MISELSGRILGIVEMLFIVLIFAITLTRPLQAGISLTPTPETPNEARDSDLLPTFEQMISANYEGCTLPCWWGLTPGKTTISQVANFFHATGFDRSWRLSRYSFTLEKYLSVGEPLFLQLEGEWVESGNFGITFSFNKDVLSAMRIQFNRMSELPIELPVTLPESFIIFRRNPTNLYSVK